MTVYYKKLGIKYKTKLYKMESDRNLQCNYNLLKSTANLM